MGARSVPCIAGILRAGVSIITGFGCTDAGLVRLAFVFECARVLIVAVGPLGTGREEDVRIGEHLLHRAVLSIAQLDDVIAIGAASIIEFPFLSIERFSSRFSILNAICRSIECVIFGVFILNPMGHIRRRRGGCWSLGYEIDRIGTLFLG